MATENGRVHRNCVNASNPYHECGMACLEKISQGQGQKEPKTKFGSRSWSFGRKKKEYDSQPNSPRVVDAVAVAGHNRDARNARSEYRTKKKTESANNDSFSSSEHYSREIHPKYHSFNKEEVRSAQTVPQSGNMKMTDKPKDPPEESVVFPVDTSQTKHGKNDKPRAPPSLEIHHDDEVVREGVASPPVGSMDFNFTGMDLTPRDRDPEEAESVISDSCVSVGKYHVRANVSSTLQLILNKYGDIVANCKLESNSMLAYYLESLCSVVQELQSISFMQITEAKVKEMLAVLKDVEAAHIDVDWLRNILNEISEAIELSTKHQTIEAAKANCKNLLELTRKELESQMKELALKETEVAHLKASVDETKARLSELEFESSQLEQTIQSAQSKVEKFSHKSLADELL